MMENIWVCLQSLRVHEIVFLVYVPITFSAVYPVLFFPSRPSVEITKLSHLTIGKICTLCLWIHLIISKFKSITICCSKLLNCETPEFQFSYLMITFLQLHTESGQVIGNYSVDVCCGSILNAALLSMHWWIHASHVHEMGWPQVKSSSLIML